MQKIIYDPITGNPSAIETTDGDQITQIPISADCPAFVAWEAANREEKSPLDYLTPIEVKPDPTPTMGERMQAVEDAVMSIILGGELV